MRKKKKMKKMNVRKMLKIYKHCCKMFTLVGEEKRLAAVLLQIGHPKG